MTLQLQFKPVSHSWVALHPKPQGVIQFIGGAFFGTFAPMLFYRRLLQYFFHRSYSIILLPFDFTFNHYREAGFLLREQYRIFPELVRIALLEGYDYQTYLNERNYIWMGHSLGCKYISLLEGFGALPEDKQEREAFIRELLSHVPNECYSGPEIQSIITELDSLFEVSKQEITVALKLADSYIEEYTTEQSVKEKLDFSSYFIKNQLSILLAPDISNTASAIRPRFLANLIDKLGLGVKPTPALTHQLIIESNLFNLLGLVCFQSDKIAAKTCQWFTQTLGKPPEKDQKDLSGGHLRPLGIPIGNFVFNPVFDPLLSKVGDRDIFLEDHLHELLETLRNQKVMKKSSSKAG